ncbi:MAG: zinc transport system permease protein [Thermoanaerobaculia bacterium]|jgi:ABC-type Mn2+/Zn2+ transport system permease subunit|nr:zinc transport system permease protein [Thermoanaerobaculia bacterium]
MIASSVFAVVLGLASALVAGLVGSFALMKRMTLAGDVISHLALPGLGLAFLWHFPPLAGAAATLAIGIVLIDQLQRRSGLIAESAIGVVFVAALAVGTLVTPTEDLIDALFGGFAAINAFGFVLGLAGCAIVAATIYLLRHQLILGIFSPDLARSLKINVDRANTLYLASFGLTVLLGLHFLGALLVGAMIIVPPAVARRMASTLDQYLILSALTSMTAVGLGFAISFEWHLPLGPTIVAVASLIFAASLAKKM